MTRIYLDGHWHSIDKIISEKFKIDDDRKNQISELVKNEVKKETPTSKRVEWNIESKKPEQKLDKSIEKNFLRVKDESKELEEVSIVKKKVGDTLSDEEKIGKSTGNNRNMAPNNSIKYDVKRENGNRVKVSMDALISKSSGKELSQSGKRSLPFANDDENQTQRKSVGLNTSKIYDGPLLKTDPNYIKNNTLASFDDENQLVNKDNQNIKNKEINGKITENQSSIVDPRRKLKKLKSITFNEVNKKDVNFDDNNLEEKNAQDVLEHRLSSIIKANENSPQKIEKDKKLASKMTLTSQPYSGRFLKADPRFKEKESNMKNQLHFAGKNMDTNVTSNQN
ncbi:DgyrCDS10710 [Dimorphilus gyrociliatus]|uniref:DgyrCDS10710 n=1 Tax=Dimorphilus gyrociliatus TaxID=2664684 RepID=A0A7I8W639_9ANNE|nr:DgyrCDS10710 [Dimorphilus gyrociliatus]